MSEIRRILKEEARYLRNSYAPKSEEDLKELAIKELKTRCEHTPIAFNGYLAVNHRGRDCVLYNGDSVKVRTNFLATGLGAVVGLRTPYNPSDDDLEMFARILLNKFEFIMTLEQQFRGLGCYPDKRGFNSELARLKKLGYGKVIMPYVRKHGMKGTLEDSVRREVIRS